MSVIEAVTVVRYRTKLAIGERRRKFRGTKRLAYRDAAWAKIRARCWCRHVDEVGGVNVVCRYHAKEHRAVNWPGSYEDAPYYGFLAPEVWGLPRREEPGYWDYGRAVAFRLARFYAYLDSRAPSPSTPNTKE